MVRENLYQAMGVGVEGVGVAGVEDGCHWDGELASE